ncbi:MAG TPA: hypothetical protein VEZ15_09030 [Acidimicrobiia bacterium]|jgi:hypothetical protein|nr:hypothetical protein [Acidimicrobiia bacterium]
MTRWFLRLMYELGTGRAVENARREHDEAARTYAGIAALEARVAALYAAQRRVAA